MAGSKANFQVGLQFSADTAQARKQIAALQNEFNKLATSTNFSSTGAGIGEASKAAAELAANLQLAVNADTGKLDLNKFSANLKASGRTLEQYQQLMGSLGADGKRAFNNLTNAIVQAEVPLTKANKLVTNLWTSFKQTAKYQFTASIYRGLIGGIRSAFNYAQDLNESLNNIRIVTGQSAEQMAKFAEQANKAAKQLSVTTTEYTNGALIYYQQGLSDEEVKARTDITMKLANASGVSAETASEQLTAIWNNFAKGSENLEYFADVITALGASTASSTSEISEGLEKFAAIGESVGLSYEYAASALATVTATTRQSADVVGTAFKTLFARIQDLELGDTLEDGTTLGKYSQALAAVGVNIKESNGELKAMDQILNEMAGAWSTISKDQQVALAQTVAGTRQYTQLIALMENWGFMQQNLNTAYNSTGTLQEQAGIYAESWEAARDRIKAAAENIYSSLINDKFFIDLTKAVEKFLTFIGNLIDNFGGLKGTLLTLGPLILNLFGEQIDVSIRSSINRMREFRGEAEKTAIAMKQAANNAKFSQSDTGGETATPEGRSGDALYRVQVQQKELSDFLIKNNAILSEYERKRIQLTLDQVGAQEKQLNELDQEIQKQAEILKLKKEIIASSLSSGITLDSNSDAGRAAQILEQINQAKEKYQDNQYVTNKDIITGYLDANDISSNLPTKLKTKFDSLLEKEGKEFEIELQKFLDALSNLVKKGEKEVQNTQAQVTGEISGSQAKISNKSEQIGVLKQMSTIDVSTTDGQASARKLYESLGLSGQYKLSKFFNSEDISNVEAYQKAVKAATATLESHIVKEEEGIKKTLEQNNVTAEATQKINEQTEEIKKSGQAQGETSAQASKLADSEERVARSAMQIKPVFADNITLFRQSVSAISSISGAITSTVNAFATLTNENATFSQKLSALTAVLTSSMMAFNSVNALYVSISKIKQATDTKEMTGITKKIFLKYQEILATKLSTKAKVGETGATVTSVGATAADVPVQEADAAAKLHNAMASEALAGAMLKVLWPLLAIAAAIGGIVIISKILNADADAAEKAAEKAKELSDAYKELQNSAEKLKNSISDWDKAQEGLKGLTKGTEEYKKQLEDVNNIAKEIIENNKKELAGKWSYDANGNIKFTDGALDQLEESLGRSMSEARVKSIEAEQKANQASLKASLTELVRSDGFGNNNAQREAIQELSEIYLQNGQNYGEALKTLERDQRDLIKHLDIEPYLKEVYQHQQEAINYNRELTLDFIKYHDDWNNYYNNTEEGSIEREVFVNLADQFANVTLTETKNEKQGEVLMGGYIPGNGMSDIIKYLTQADSAFGGNYKNVVDAIKDSENVPQEIIDGLYATKDTITLYGKIIAEKTDDGFTSIIENPEYNGLGHNGRGIYSSENNYNFAQAIVDILANKEFINQPQVVAQTAKETAEEFLKYFSNDNDAVNFVQGIKQGQNADYSSLTLQAAEDLKNALTTENNSLYKYYESILGSDEFNKFQENAKNAFDTYERDFNTFKENIKNSNDEIIQDFFGDFDKYGLEVSTTIRDNLKKAFISGGTEGEKQLSEILKNSKDPLGILDTLNETDWRTADFEELYSTLKGLGSEVDKNTFYDFANGLKEAADRTYILTSSLTDLFKEFKELKDITDKLSFGSVISDEDYQKYIKDKSEFDGKFVWTVDGWMFIGDKDEITITNDNIDKIRQEYATAREDASKINSSDLELSNQALARRYAYSTNEDDGYEFNQTALGLTNYNGQPLSEQALAKAFEHPEIEESKKQIEAYGAALRQLKDTEKNYADNNVLTAHVQSQYKSVDELNKNWQALSKTWGDIDDSLATQLVKIAAINEATAKGIDKEELVDYANYLKTVNKQLANNEELTYQVAVANKIAQKAYKDTVSTYEADIETLKNDDPLSEAYRTSLERMRQNLADMLSISVDELSNIQSDFFTNVDISKLYERIAQGDEEALQILTANAMIRAGQITEEEKQIYLEFLQYVADNPGTATIDAFVQLKGPGAEFLRGRAVAVDAAGIETDRNGNQATQGSIFDYNTYKPNLEKGKSSKKNLKSLDDEIDRYHYIRKLLADIERELERVDKAKERAYGSQRLKYIEQETDYLREQVGLQDRYISEIEGYLAKDRGLIAAYGAQFDAAGNISNYNELFASNFNKYANAEDSTNWENFKKALSTYEETLDLWFEQTEEKAELLRQILDKQLEGIQYKVEVNIEVNDRELELLEYQLNRLDDAAYDTADALVNIGSQFEVVEEKIKTTTNGIIDTLKTIPGITQAQIDAYLAGDGEALAGLHIEQGQIEMLQDYSSQLLELSDTIKELHDNALQKVSEAFDVWGEKIEDHIAKFQHLNTLINNYQEIIGLLGRSNIGISNEFMREMRNQEIVNLQGILNTRTQVKDNLAAQLADARKRASEAATEAEREDWEQVADDIEQRLKDATESWQQAWIDALQANKEAFEATMQDIVDSFDDYENELKRYDTAQDRYLEPYRQAYELSKLTRDIDNSINDQDSIRAKKELQKLEDKIAQIKESGRAISENELGLLQKEYELRLAEIALEDAQNAKSLVRLTRNNEGNWGYTYVADQDKIDEAQQNYEDKLYEYMRAADTMAEEASRTILTLNKEMAEALAALDANAVDYEAKVAEITQFYTDQINYFAEQYGISTDAINTVAKESAAKYKPEVVDIIESDNSGLQTNFDETVLAIIGDFEDLEDAINGPDGALPNIQRAYSETLAAFEDYREQNKLTCERAGADVSQMRELMETEFGKIKTQTKETDGATKEMAENMKSYLDAVLNNFGDFAERYSSKVNVVSNANIALANSIIGLERALNNIDASSLETLKKAADQVEAIAQTVKLAADAADGAGSGGKSNNVNQLDGYFYVGRTADGTQYWGKAGDQYGKNDIYSLKDNKLAYSWSTYGRVNSFATGGYTGEWGDSGRLALLHEKELVLNKEDTSNILNAVSLIRQLTLGTAQLSNGLGAIGAGLSNFNINPASMDQNVNISASFPNVRDRYEIEEAFNNLVNKASQYAFRENRYTPNYV